MSETSNSLIEAILRIAEAELNNPESRTQLHLQNIAKAKTHTDITYPQFGFLGLARSDQQKGKITPEQFAIILEAANAKLANFQKEVIETHLAGINAATELTDITDPDHGWLSRAQLALRKEMITPEQFAIILEAATKKTLELENLKTLT